MNLNQPLYIEPRNGINHLELCGIWNYTYTDEALNDISNISWNMKTMIPNSVYWSLYESGVLPHPYKGCNCKQYNWVDEKVWYYQKEFVVNDEQNLGKAFLCIDGAAYYTRVWINGILIGEHEGMFGGPITEINDKLNFHGKNEIIIEIKACNYGIKDSFDPLNINGGNTAIVPWFLMRERVSMTGDFIVLGLWQKVRIEFLPDLHLGRPYLVTKEINSDSAILRLTCEISSSAIKETELASEQKCGAYEYTFAYRNGLSGKLQSESVTIKVKIFEKGTGKTVYENGEEYSLYEYEQSGINPKYYECQFYNLNIRIENPNLWFPNGMGSPELYTAEIKLLKDNCVLDSLNFDCGIRTIALEDTMGRQYRARWGKFLFTINGKKQFLKGMNWQPIDLLLKLQKEKYLWLLKLAKNAGVQLIRVWSGGGIPETDDFYKICDELGIMVWQDNFIANMDTPNWPLDILHSQVCMNLYRIRNHPSLAVHCGGNEFNPYSLGNAASMFVIESDVRDIDASRPFMRAGCDKGSAHVYRDMEPTWYRKYYKQLPFMGESGIHSFPNVKSLKKIISKDEFDRPLSKIFDSDFSITNPELFVHFVEYNPARIPRMMARASYINDISNISIQNLVEATQLASCEFYKIMIEAMRENYPVTGGVMPWVFNRAWTSIGIQLVDGEGDPVAPYYYVKNAYNNMIAIVCLDELTFAAGETVKLPIKIINEHNSDLRNAEMVLSILNPGLQKDYEFKKALNVTSMNYEYIDAGDFIIPSDYEEKFFFITIKLIKDEEILYSSVYWPKCLNRMKDEEFRIQYRNNICENFNFDKGPWLKKQTEGAEKALVSSKIVRTSRAGNRAGAILLLQNLGNVPAFPVNISIEDEGTISYLNDNYFLLDIGESKEISVEISSDFGKSMPLRIYINVSAWNMEKVSFNI